MITLDQFPEELRKLAEQLKERIINEAIPNAAPAFLAEYKVRIFEQGLDSEGNKIGNYSTKPLYASKKMFVNKSSFKGVGKTGEQKFKTGQAHKSMYLPGGVREFREIQGREGSFVNQSYSTSLSRGINIYDANGNTVVAIADSKESVKRKAQEKHFGKVIYSAAQKETDVFGNAVVEEVKIIVKEIFA